MVWPLLSTVALPWMVWMPALVVAAVVVDDDIAAADADRRDRRLQRGVALLAELAADIAERALRQRRRELARRGVGIEDEFIDHNLRVGPIIMVDWSRNISCAWPSPVVTTFSRKATSEPITIGRVSAPGGVPTAAGLTALHHAHARCGLRPGLAGHKGRRRHAHHQDLRICRHRLSIAFLCRRNRRLDQKLQVTPADRAQLLYLKLGRFESMM